MVPINQVFMLERSAALDRGVMQRVLDSGHSRIPIYSGKRDNVKHILLAKSLITINPDEEIPIHQVLSTAKRPMLFASPHTSLYEILNEFQKGQSHIVFVTNEAPDYQTASDLSVDAWEHASLLGIVTLEDVIEELIQEEILDEFDVYRRTSRVSPMSLQRRSTELRNENKQKRVKMNPTPTALSSTTYSEPTLPGNSHLPSTRSVGSLINQVSRKNKSLPSKNRT
eukprot:GHVO01052183.1.p1 GENE.GHVO01052183.1~~GHVO01052183.1.p1  ORF type:complete len:226 (+),score=36.84 GHVO01052183.1:337-1014(+)